MKKFEALKSVNFETTGLNENNCNVVYHQAKGGPKSWAPGNELSAIKKTQKGEEYLIDLKADVDISEYFKEVEEE
jgi:hypothetical protein